MSAGLMLVHMMSRWPMDNDKNDDALDPFTTTVSSVSTGDKLSDGETQNMLNSFTNGLINMVGTEQILMIGLMFALTIKYFWFENYDSRININSDYSAQSFKNSELISKEDSEISSNISESCSNTTSTTPSSTRPTTPTTLTSDESDNLSQHTVKSSIVENSILNENSDTESVLGQCRHKCK